jgi:hypothetical protein
VDRGPELPARTAYLHARAPIIRDAIRRDGRAIFVNERRRHRAQDEGRTSAGRAGKPASRTHSLFLRALAVEGSGRADEEEVRPVGFCRVWLISG